MLYQLSYLPLLVQRKITESTVLKRLVRIQPLSRDADYMERFLGMQRSNS